MQAQSASKALHRLLHLATQQKINIRAFTVRASVAAAPERSQEPGSKQSPESLTITQPDDWHLHLRDGPAMESCVKHSAAQFGRAIIMPNLKPPVVSTGERHQRCGTRAGCEQKRMALTIPPASLAENVDCIEKLKHCFD